MVINFLKPGMLASAGATALAAVFSIAISAPAKAVPVDVELQLLVDVSGSVSSSEFNLQRDGYVSAFQSQAIKDAITDTSGGRIGKIAAQFIYWSGGSQQEVAVDWFEIGTDAQSDDFASAISGTSRPFNNNTAPGSAINFGFGLFDNNGFEGTSLVMDVSGDGVENEGDDTSDARDAALAAGVTRINGLPIGGNATVEAFFQNNIVGGTNGFLIASGSFNDFESAVAKKLEFEITGETPVIPLPAALPLVLTGLGALGGLGALRRRKEKAIA